MAAHSVHRLTVATPVAVRRGHLPMGEPAGTPDRIDVTSQSIERAGLPTFPITGEIHYSRIDRERWNEVLGHAKAGGLTSVATYVLWQAHEPAPGQFEWGGNLDLRAFVTLAARHGLDVVVRLGPWAHGEARHGGFPDWLVDRDLATRTNDPDYLALVRRLYAQTIEQLAGLSHHEGGPVIAAQVDNELYDQPEHLATLRQIAEELGLRVPIWTATGWGGAQVPDVLLPVYSAYADGFWEDELVEWPHFSAVHFGYSTVRDDLTVGADLREALDGVGVDSAAPLGGDEAVPFVTCELGGGMHVAYHRRPLVTPRDVAALAHAKIGSGSVWQGYYMYAGGTQRVGPHGTEHESHATGYPNDVPARTYDFHAPVGEYGQVREHHHLLRRQHLWLRAEGAALAGMTTTIGGGDSGSDALRWAVRAGAERGYLFATTYQPDRAPLSEQRGVQFSVTLESGTVVVPSEPVDLPAGISVAWPLRLPVGEVLLRSATAELLTRVGLDGDRELVVFTAADGIAPEFVFEGDLEVDGPVTVRPHDGGTVVTLTSPPSPETVIDVAGARMLVLDGASANRAYLLDVFGRERLVLSDCPVYVDGDHLVAHAAQESVRLSFLPPPATLSSADAALAADAASSGWWGTWTASSTAGTVPLPAPGDLGASAGSPHVRGGPLQRLSAPTDFSQAATVDVDIPPGAAEGVDRALLRVSWSGDIARAIVDGEVVSDHFWHGRDWDIDVTGTPRVTLECLPWGESHQVWVDPSVRPVAQGVAIDSLAIVRVARVRLTATATAEGRP